jgi:hypothetical protein
VWNGGSGLVSNNDLTTASLSRFGLTLGDTTDRALLIAQWQNLTPGQRTTAAQKGISLPYNGFPQNQTVRQSLRAFPQYNTSVNPTAAPLGKNWYDSLQVTLTKRYSHGLTLNANYTFSKALSQSTSPDVFNRALGKNLSGADLPHQFRISAEYQTPRIGAGVPVFGKSWVSYLLSGWGLGIYAQYQSAQILERPAPGAGQPISDWLGRGPCVAGAFGPVGCAQLKKDPQTGDYMSPWAVNWTDYNGKVHAEPLDINCKCYDPAKTIVLNKDAWESVPNAQWANDYTNLRFWRGVRRPQESANLSRNFRFKEGRITLQIRAEVNNVFNRTLLPNPTTNGSTSFTTAPTLTNGVYTGGFGSFGNVTGGAGLGAARSGLLIGRFQF